MLSELHLTTTVGRAIDRDILLIQDPDGDSVQCQTSMWPVFTSWPLHWATPHGKALDPGTTSLRLRALL